MFVVDHFSLSRGSSLPSYMYVFCRLYMHCVLTTHVVTCFSFCSLFSRAEDDAGSSRKRGRGGAHDGSANGGDSQQYNYGNWEGYAVSVDKVMWPMTASVCFIWKGTSAKLQRSIEFPEE